MYPQTGLIVVAALSLGACSGSFTGASDTTGARQVPEAVVAMAGPNQDLLTARLMPENGCYWYLHNGPVETTLLPLRTAAGNPICQQSAT
ncbi:hypothetical protein [uncultured Sulfitobacter sp.]|uniref:hypothetical protein n=1 Tax=uncultured Sulfitobacter sp. TaxID=191468 RepID=UPI0026288B96|nr:hypothetical protein [uncultured Sulfitobacter sp.]